jgi:hypothetical protein
MNISDGTKENYRLTAHFKASRMTRRRRKGPEAISRLSKELWLASSADSVLFIKIHHKCKIFE